MTKGLFTVEKMINLLVLSLLLSLGACAHKKLIADKIVIKEKVASINGLWVKDKSNKFDMAVRITNLSSKTLLIPKGSMMCRKGAIEGSILKTSLERVSTHATWLISPEESVIFYFTCVLQIHAKGDMSFKLNTIYESTNPDSPQRGDMLADGLEITSPQD